MQNSLEGAIKVTPLSENNGSFMKKMTPAFTGTSDVIP